ncbi:MAG: imidazoleglycerol-phosphate dehydratase [Planctomycetales bacterium 12-60-4]|nr:MAG: imidazoleglycerol-phosphate dehydratase [Planctomycetales bacterium 12-60-4]
MTSRTAEINRQTAETKISLKLNLDGTGQSQLNTGVGFLDHMLTLFAKHGLFDLTVTCDGDTQVDAHHSTEDIGICLGQAFAKGLGDKRGITRYGHMILPMEETLVTVAVDLSGRNYVVFNAPIPSRKIGEFDSELVEDFWYFFASNAMCNYHVLLQYGRNSHHIAEAIFKASARALRMAIAVDPRQQDVPSTKGLL